MERKTVAQQARDRQQEGNKLVDWLYENGDGQSSNWHKNNLIYDPWVLPPKEEAWFMLWPEALVPPGAWNALVSPGTIG